MFLILPADTIISSWTMLERHGHAKLGKEQGGVEELKHSMSVLIRTVVYMKSTVYVRSYILQLRVDGTFNGQGSAVGVVLELFRGG